MPTYISHDGRKVTAPSREAAMTKLWGTASQALENKSPGIINGPAAPRYSKPAERTTFLGAPRWTGFGLVED